MMTTKVAVPAPTPLPPACRAHACVVSVASIPDVRDGVAVAHNGVSRVFPLRWPDDRHDLWADVFDWLADQHDGH
jgi:hypothetical protein